MKEKIILALVAFIILTNYNSTVKANWQGTGSETNPFQIWNKADIEALADSVNNGDFWSRGKHFKLMQDITDSVRTIIGFSYNMFGGYSNPESKEYFDGVFDGNNKKIVLAISTVTTGGSTGLFGVIGRNGVVKNVEVEGYVLSEINRNKAMPVAGGIAAVNYGRIEFCINKCNITIRLGNCNSEAGDFCGDHAGGIAGNNFGHISHTVNFGNVSIPFHDAGGIVGSSYSLFANVKVGAVVISHSVNFGSVYSQNSAGGIIGHSRIAGMNDGVNSVLISNCINLGNVYCLGWGWINASGGVAGGIIGAMDEMTAVAENNLNAGFVSGSSLIGGIAGVVGYHTYGMSTIRNSISVGVISTLPCLVDAAFLGGIVGSFREGTLSNNFYDKQLCIYGGIGNAKYDWEGNIIGDGMGEDIPGQAEGRLTREMLGTQLRAILGDEHWVYRDGLYPMLRAFANNKLCEIAISPVHFYVQGANYETHNNLYNDFTVNLANNVRWTNAFDRVSISGNQGTVNKAGRDTLYAGKRDTFRLNAQKFVVMNARKTVPVRSVDSLLLTLYANPEYGGTVEGSGKFINETLVTIKAIPNDCYRFLNWTDSATGNIVSWNQIWTFCIQEEMTLIANFRYICPVLFTIRASEHKFVDPRSTNYKIPIYIKADKNISNYLIEKLVLEIDRSIYYFRGVDNGYLVSNDNGLLTFANVTVPALLANEEKLLMNIRGDVLLGLYDSSEIFVREVKFIEDVSEAPVLIDGFITLDICGEGGARFLLWRDPPSITVKVNPVSDILEVECKIMERGNHSIEIVDMQGKSLTVKEFSADPEYQTIHNFEISVRNFSSGSYIIILHTPNSKYSTGFVRQ